MSGLANVCRFTPTLGGTTDWTYSAFVTGYQSPTNAGAVDGRIYHYRAESADLSQWELGEGAYTASTDVFARTTVLFNSSGTGTKQSGTGTKINFSTVPQVAIVALAEDLLEVVATNRTYYVRSDGSNSNTGLADSAGGAFLTLQYAYDLIRNTLFIQAGITVTIQMKDTGSPVTFTGGLVALGRHAGPGSIAVAGGTPANIIVTSSAIATISAAAGAYLTISGIEIRNSANGVAVYSIDGGDITCGANLRLGNVGTGDHFQASGGKIHITASYTISAGGTYHWHSRLAGARIDALTAGIVITLSGTPNFIGAFAGANFAQIYLSPGCVAFSGSATGVRFFSHNAARIDSGSLGYRGFPGDVEGTRNAGGQYDAETDEVATLRAWRSGLTLSVAGSTATFGVAAGIANDSINIMMMALASAYTKTASAWAVGSGNGALDTGAIAASTWYHVFLIKRPDTAVVDVLISLSATAPTMPSGYVYFRRIGSMKTDGSSQWVKFVQDGKRFMWTTPIRDINQNTPGTTAVTRILPSLPLGLRVQAHLSALVITTNGTAGAAVYLSDLLQDDLVASASVFSIEGYSDLNAATHTFAIGAQVSVMTDVSQQIRSRVGVSAVDLNLMISVHGWTDPLGE